MLQDLRKYSRIGSKSGIIQFCRKAFTGKEESVSSLRDYCSFTCGFDLDFNCAIAAFDALGLLSVNNDTCVGTEISFIEMNEDKFMYQVCKRCFEVSIDNGLFNLHTLHYKESIGQYLIPNTAFKLEGAVLRNLLISFGALESDNGYLIVNGLYEGILVNTIKAKSKKTQEQLLKDLEKERIMGEEGESFVLSYELQRCAFSPEQLTNIKQISLIDVSAGYDIISYHDTASTQRRYIEVKTYKGKPHFYWSSNEIYAAKLRGEDYFLYLVDYERIKEPGYMPRIIPFAYQIFEENSDWEVTPSSYLFKEIDSL